MCEGMGLQFICADMTSLLFSPKRDGEDGLVMFKVSVNCVYDEIVSDGNGADQKIYS